MNRMEYGSDLMADALSQLGLEYIAINPGATFRGLHESLVDAGDPKMILALHENVAVAAAHGYAKSAGRPMAVALHNLVGLQSGSMSIFNAWADQVPIVIVGGSGPADAARRRPWIDWVHSARTQSLAIREYVKWDDQPASLDAIRDSLLRAHKIATTVPCGPTYVALDVLLQEQPLRRSSNSIMTISPPGPTSLTAPQPDIERLAAVLLDAEEPVIVADYVGKNREGYNALIELAELLAIPVIDMQARHNFPTDHWADGTLGRRELLGRADLVLALEMRDVLYGIGETDAVNHTVTPLVRPNAHVISVGTNQLMLKGFIDFCGPDIAGTEILADSSVLLPSLVGLIRDVSADRGGRRARLSSYTTKLREQRQVAEGHRDQKRITAHSLSSAVAKAVGGLPWQIANGDLRGAVRETWELSSFNSHLGINVGGGLGYGIGASIGAALAHRHDDTIIVNLQSDGDLLYSPQGLWTAARYDLPILTVVVNNRTYGQDRMHQTLIANSRSRSLEHASVGIDIDDPDIDFAGLARAQGIESWGAVETHDRLEFALNDAVRTVSRERRPALVEVLVQR